MLKRLLDYSKAMLVVLYLRMSSDLQNPRSPDQQQYEIEKRIEKLKLPWQIVKIYRDDARSGRYIGKRPQYQQMMKDLRSGAVRADAILVDTLERFGRVDELPIIRKTLSDKYGVLVLTANSAFADPNTEQGKALGQQENTRASTHCVTLAYNVVRGKHDAARQKHWPGSMAPLGYRLEYVMRTDRGREVVDHSTLVPDPSLAPFIRKLFIKAAETGWAGTKLAKYFRYQPDTPEQVRSLSPSTIVYCLENEIYYGELVWGRYCTGIVDDTRVVEPNSEDDITRISDFCEPLISRELWQQVADLRQARKVRAHGARTANEEKMFKALAPGVALRYLLSGLLRCPICGLRMRATSTGSYETKSGEEKKYTKYKCLGFASGQCSNRVKVPEEWLRQQVVTTIRAWLFPDAPSAPENLNQPWLEELLCEVQKELDHRHQEDLPQPALLQHEQADLSKKRHGWLQSLADPDLPPAIRQALQTEWAATETRLQEIALLLREGASRLVQARAAISMDDVKERLASLDRILGDYDPTLGNMVLSTIIDRIDCWPDGRIIMRTCKLGLLPDAAVLVMDRTARDETSASTGSRPEDGMRKGSKGQPRRRTRLQVPEEDNRDSDDHRATLDFVADLNRFSGLDEKWFFTTEFKVAPKGYWIDNHHADVKDKHAELEEERGTKPTIAELARHFDVSEPAIVNALKYPDDRRARDRRHTGGYTPSITEEQKAEVVRRYVAEEDEKDIARCMKISRGSITKALDEWDARRGEKRMDGRKRRWSKQRSASDADQAAS